MTKQIARGHRKISAYARKRILELARDGHSTYAIVRHLNERRFKPARGQRWRETPVLRVLKAAGLYQPRTRTQLAEATIERIVEMFRAGSTLSQIARQLRAEGAPTAAGNVRAILLRRGELQESPEAVAERFRRKVVVAPGAHHDWKGSRDASGRPRFHVNGKTAQVSRYAYELTNGPLPQGAQLLNVCGDSACVNPGHWRLKGTDEEEFWRRVTEEPATGCWLWGGLLTKKGYGKAYAGGKHRMAHRVAFEWRHGPLKAGQLLHHVCRRRACVRPSHLVPIDGNEQHLRGHELEDAVNAAFEDGSLVEAAKEDAEGKWPGWPDDREIGSGAGVELFRVREAA